MGNSPGSDAREAMGRLSMDPCDVQVAASEIFRVAGMGAYHTSIIVGDREYYFDCQGIESAPPFWSHGVPTGEADPGHTLRFELLNLGASSLTGKALLKGLAPFFAEGSYDIIHKNCNAFTDAALYFLTRGRLEPRFSRMERALAAAAPLSTGMLNGLVRAASLGGEDLEHWEYAANPVAVGFSVEEVIAACDALDAEARPGASRSTRWCCTALCQSAVPEAVVAIPARSEFVVDTAADDAVLCATELGAADDAVLRATELVGAPEYRLVGTEKRRRQLPL